MRMILILLCLTLFLSSCQNYKIESEKSWILNPELSNIAIVTTKNNKVSEVSDFNSFSGSISSSGYLEIEIQLNSLETNIPIRNERIQQHLFQTNLYPTADIHTQLKVEDLTDGIHHISFDVDLHGVSAIIDADFMVFSQFDNKVVTLNKPLVVNAKTFSLDHGIVTLKKIAKLESINFTVPLNIVLTFEPN